MTQLRSHPSPAARGTAAPTLRILLLALLATGCSDLTGPRAPAPGPPADDMRVASLTLTEATLGSTTRHHFLYDGAGRLRRVDVYVNEVPGGPATQLAHYTEHTYARDRLSESNYFTLGRVGSTFLHSKRIDYDHDPLGYLVRETAYLEISPPDVAGEPADETVVTRYRYDAEGRLVEKRQDNGERTVHAYGGDGSLALTEFRYPGDTPTFRQSYSYAGGRSPFYRRLAHASSLSLPVDLPSMLLAPGNPARQEIRMDPDPKVISSVTNEYRFDSAGRPLHIRQVFEGGGTPEPQSFVVLFDFAYEPAASSTPAGH